MILNSFRYYLMETGSYFDFNQNTSEQVFHSFMLGLVVGLKRNYVIQSNQESGLGRLDVVFIPKMIKPKTAFYWNLKSAKRKSCTKSSRSISTNQRSAIFDAFKSHGMRSFLAVGMAFCGKQVELAHERIEIK